MRQAFWSSLSLRWNLSWKHHTYLSLKSLANGCAALGGVRIDGAWLGSHNWLDSISHLRGCKRCVCVFLCVCTYIGVCMYTNQFTLVEWGRREVLVKLTHGSKDFRWSLPCVIWFILSLFLMFSLYTSPVSFLVKPKAGLFSGISISVLHVLQDIKT